MTSERDARIKQLRQEAAAAHDAFMTASDAGDFTAMIDASQRGRDASDELTRLTNPPSWQAMQLVTSWPPDVRKSFAEWMTGYNPDAVLLFELSRRNLPTARKED